MRAVPALRALPLVIGAALALGCVRAPPLVRVDPAARVDPPAHVDPVVYDQVLASAAAQVRRCYRAPRVASVGREIVTRVEVRLNADGTLAGLPALVSQSGVTPFNRPYAGPMAEAASLAIIRCAPLRLPAEHYKSMWAHFQLSFSPSAAA